MAVHVPTRTDPRPRGQSSRQALASAGSGGRIPTLVLVFISLAQLVIALDATIMNIALPAVQSALAISDADRQWPIIAYTLAFGGLVLLGGRVADLAGRRRTFLFGLVNAAQQVGGSVGTALLNTIAASSTAAYLATRASSPGVVSEALVHGFSGAAIWGAGILTTAALLAAVLINSARPAPADR